VRASLAAIAVAATVLAAAPGALAQDDPVPEPICGPGQTPIVDHCILPPVTTVPQCPPGSFPNGNSCCLPPPYDCFPQRADASQTELGLPPLAMPFETATAGTAATGG
jgi:hypothetical protein